LGFSGICACQLHIWKIFDDTPKLVWGRRRFEYLVDPVMYRRALSDCLDLNIDVINLSIGGRGAPDFQERKLFRALVDGGATVVAAMGNDRELGSPLAYPAAIDGVIAVGATSFDDAVASFSSGGQHIAITVPGEAIWSTVPTYPGQFGFRLARQDGNVIKGAALPRPTKYASWQGTSMASPHVAAAAALLIANEGGMNSASVRARLQNTADRVPGMAGTAFHHDYGTGRLNLLRLLTP